MDLALDNLQMLICHKTQSSNQQPNSIPIFKFFSYVANSFMSSMNNLRLIFFWDIILLNRKVFTSALTDVFHWHLRDKSHRVSWTLFSILADFDNTLVWMISTRSLISTSSSPCTNSLVTVPSTPITIGITVTFTFPSIFNSLESSWYLCLFSPSFSFNLWSTGSAKFTIWQVLIFVDYHKVPSSGRD